MNRVVEIQQATEARDEFGEPIETWTTIRTLHAARKDVRGWERFRADQELAARTSTFTMRWFAGLTAKMRIQHDSTVWDIEGIAELGRRVALEVTATAVRV
ncbi:MAG TPA: phage head closure protein [Hyphomicrobiaceae bacterium]|nr:phage head closure protein [Hyphomicrobiaceae bacterium]